MFFRAATTAFIGTGVGLSTAALGFAEIANRSAKAENRDLQVKDVVNPVRDTFVHLGVPSPNVMSVHQDQQLMQSPLTPPNMSELTRRENHAAQTMPPITTGDRLARATPPSFRSGYGGFVASVARGMHDDPYKMDFL